MTIRQPIITVAGHVDHGKCVAGDTIIPLVDGTMKKAQELYDENVDTIKLKKIDDGFLQDITDKNIRIFSFNGKNIEPASISHIWKRQAKRLIEVKTSSGDIIKTTPEHPFFVFSLEGIRTRKAEDLKENDYIALPKKLPFQSQNIKDKIISRLKNLDNFVCFLNEKFQQKFDKIKKFKDVEKKLNISHLRDSIAKKRLRIKDLFILAEHYKIPDEEAYDCIQSIKNSSTIWRGGHTSKKMQLPNLEENEKFGYLLGCIAGDGHLSKTRVILNNNDLEVQTAYRESLKEIFELESTTEQAHTCQIVVDKGGKTFLRFMTDVIGFPKKNKSATVEVPALAKKNKEVFRGFIAGLFDTDGYVSKLNNSIEITSKSENMLKQCATYLLSFGIHATLYKKNIYTVLRIANKIYLNRFLDNFRPRLKRKLKRIIDSSIKAQSSRIFDFIPLQGANLKQLEVKGKINKQIPYFNKYMHTSALSIAFLQAVVSNLKKDNEISRKLREILETDISYVKVTSKKAIDNEEKYVYDFTVPNNHNFVAERILVHNTSLLDCFRGSSVQAGEAGGITQKISFTKYPLEQIEKVCPLIKKNKVKLKIPGFLFIDTPGHAAFTNLRKRGGALADLAILVIDIKKGIEPQTAEVLSILKANKTPFVVALNKIDNLSGWKKRDSIKEAVETQALNVKEEFDTALLTFQGALQAHGFDSALYYELGDFTKKIAIVPCSAKTKEGIPELLFVLCGLCQKFLSKQLELAEDAKGVILEVKKERGMEYAEAILYDGDIAVNEEIMIASLDKPITTKIRTLEEIQPLAFKYKAVQHATAATGIRVQLTEREGLLPGMPFQEIKGNFDEIANSFKKEISGVTKLDKKGVIIKAVRLWEVIIKK
ncbi:MAG: GTP-binding protein, partial [Nanoarchaeota archaeon]